MATFKMTFSLDRTTAARIDQAAQRLGKAKSEVVREAVAEYSARVGRLSDGERRELLRTFDRLVTAIPKRPAAEVDAELAELRSARRTGGRGSASPRRR
jgi:metal-responsive CopG/Arc/MetJ family transcriptional regulator